MKTTCVAVRMVCGALSALPLVARAQTSADTTAVVLHPLLRLLSPISKMPFLDAGSTRRPPPRLPI